MRTLNENSKGDDMAQSKTRFTTEIVRIRGVQHCMTRDHHTGNTNTIVPKYSGAYGKADRLHNEQRLATVADIGYTHTHFVG